MPRCFVRFLPKTTHEIKRCIKFEIRNPVISNNELTDRSAELLRAYRFRFSAPQRVNVANNICFVGLGKILDVLVRAFKKANVNMCIHR